VPIRPPFASPLIKSAMTTVGPTPEKRINESWTRRASPVGCSQSDGVSKSANTNKPMLAASRSSARLTMRTDTGIAVVLGNKPRRI